MDKITAKDIVADERELWLNSPVGYLYAERINQREEGRLKSFLINIFAQGDDASGDAIRNASLEDCVQTLLNSNFTFDTEWFGIRALPTRPDGTVLGKLDDPEYQRKMGFSQ